MEIAESPKHHRFQGGSFKIDVIVWKYIPGQNAFPGVETGFKIDVIVWKLNKLLSGAVAAQTRL